MSGVHDMMCHMAKSYSRYYNSWCDSREEEKIKFCYIYKTIMEALLSINDNKNKYVELAMKVMVNMDILELEKIIMKYENTED